MNARPLHDRLLVRRLEDRHTTKSKIIIPDAAKEKPKSGEILGAGNGKPTRILGRISCFLRQQHAAEPTRTVNHGQSAFTCARCGAALRDLDEAGYGSGYIDPLRRLYERQYGVITRTSSWETEHRIA
jgi:Chaperonin 10 Kd subunit